MCHQLKQFKIMFVLKNNRRIRTIISIIIIITLHSLAPTTYAEMPLVEEHSIDKTDIPLGTFRLLAEVPRGYVQGGCYVEDGLYLFCYTSRTSDNLTLKCFDSKRMKFVWEKILNGGAHGNSICFRPADRKIYIADCYSYTNPQKLLSTISVADFDNIDAGIIETIQVPDSAGIYSIAYDMDTDTFYSTNYRGTKEGYANALFSYDGVFERVKDIVYLDDYTVRYDPVHSSQGVQCVKDGIAYIPYYSPSPKVAGFDISTGNLVFALGVPKTVEKRDLGELEAIMYDPDNYGFTLLTSMSFLQYLDDGNTLEGWEKENDSFWYYYIKGERVKNQVQEINGKKYLFLEDGKMLSDDTSSLNGNNYRALKGGILFRNQWFQDDQGAWYFYGNDCAMAKNITMVINGKQYVFDSMGRMMEKD